MEVGVSDVVWCLSCEGGFNVYIRIILQQSCLPLCTTFFFFFETFNVKIWSQNMKVHKIAETEKFPLVPTSASFGQFNTLEGMHTYIHTYILTYMHTYIHTYLLTYMHTYIHTYLHTPQIWIVLLVDTVLFICSCNFCIILVVGQNP